MMRGCRLPLGSPPVELCRNVQLDQVTVGFRLNSRGGLVSHASEIASFLSIAFFSATPGA